MNEAVDKPPDKRAENLRHYVRDDVVKTYASIYGLFPPERVLIEQYFPKGSRILDLACGGGRTTLPLHELGYRVTGIDLSEPLIRAAQARNPAVDFRVGSFCKLDYPDGHADGVFISNNSLDCAFPETQRVEALREAVRVLSPGGVLLFSSHNIKALHGSPYYYYRRRLRRIRWALRHLPCAFKDRDYIWDLSGQWLFHGSQKYVIAQACQCGLAWLDTVGFRLSRNYLFNHFCSLWLDFAFRKP